MKHQLSRVLAAALIAWSTLAVGGVYVWASIPIILLALALTARVRPGIAHRPDLRPLDLTVLAVLGLACLQVVPVPARLRWALSPHLDVDRLALLLMPDAASTWEPLSLDAAATGYALALLGAGALVFWSCRHLCGRGHMSFLVGVVAGVGLAGAVAAIVQRAVAPTLIFGLWSPVDVGARPFGPFVNRNHFATWLLMAISLTAGAIATAAGQTRRDARLSTRIASALHAIGARQGWMVAALVAMTLALVFTFSRGALVGAIGVMGAWGALSLRRVTRRGVLISAGAIAGVGLVLTLTASPGPLLARVQETLVLGMAERGGIWHDASTAARAYAATGTGLGTFDRAMLIYQTSDRRTHTNQAHNQYLQTLAEAGIPLTLLMAAVCVVFARLVQRRLREDGSDAVWLRIGSVAGLVGVATQSLWETGLRMPANGVLLALVAAVAVHRPGPAARERTSPEPPRHHRARRTRLLPVGPRERTGP